MNLRKKEFKNLNYIFKKTYINNIKQKMSHKEHNRSY